MPAVGKPNHESWSKIHFHFKNCISCSKDSSEGEGALSRVLQYGSHFDLFQYVTCVPLGPPAVGVENYGNGRGGQVESRSLRTNCTKDYKQVEHSSAFNFRYVILVAGKGGRRGGGGW